MSILQDLLAMRETPVALAEDKDLSAGEAKGYAEELEGLHQKMSECMNDVRHIVRQLPHSMRASAEAYFIPHIMIALGGEHEWMTAGHEVTLQKVIDELKEFDGDEDDGGPKHDDEDHGAHEYR